ncbi:transposase [Streptomyces goshikiensis]|uniref:transposase n=1 Tax=Streptomyces goshikiensis TaxID=1942 RepID=UPI00365D87E5
MTDAERAGRERVRLQAVAGAWLKLRRHGWFWQQPARHAIDRRRGGAMETGGLAAGKNAAAANNAWVVFEDEAGQSMTPPRARTWGRQGSTPVVRVRGHGSGPVSMAAILCRKPGERSRLIYAIREYRGRRDEPKGFGWRDHRELISRAHTQLGGPIVLVWDNLRMHLVAPLREFFETSADWLTVFQLPSYAPASTHRRGSGHWPNGTSATSSAPA